MSRAPGAKVAYVGPKPGDLPAALKGLSREAYEAIRPAEGRGIWAGQDIGYSLEPLLRGSIFDTPVALFLIENGLVRPIAYDKASFAAPGIELPDLDAATAFSGFRLRARFAEGGALSDFALFQGGSFFHLVAEGQDFGINARALALRPADARGEEFPLFRALFIETPTPASRSWSTPSPNPILRRRRSSSPSRRAGRRRWRGSTVRSSPGPISTISGSAACRAATCSGPSTADTSTISAQRPSRWKVWQYTTATASRSGVRCTIRKLSRSRPSSIVGRRDSA